MGREFARARLLSFRRTLTGKLSKLTYHVRLIRVAAIEGKMGPLAQGALANQPQQILKAHGTRQHFRGETNPSTELAFQLTRTQIQLAGNIADSGFTATANDLADSRLETRTRRGSRKLAAEKLFHQLLSLNMA